MMISMSQHYRRNAVERYPDPSELLPIPVDAYDFVQTRNHVNSTRIARRLGHAGIGGAAANTKNGPRVICGAGRRS